MKEKKDPGIDYSFGRNNYNTETGIHFGIISLHALNMDCISDFEPDYGSPTCPECGSLVHDLDDLPEDVQKAILEKEEELEEYACEQCERTWDNDYVWREEPLGHTYEENGYVLELTQDNEVWVYKSPFVTRCVFCSPCAPGAGDLSTFCEIGPLTYCLGPDFFEKDEAPYPYRAVDSEVWQNLQESEDGEANEESDSDT